MIATDSTDLGNNVNWQFGSTPPEQSSIFPSLSWHYYLPITIPASKLSSTLTDFPVSVDLSTLPQTFFDYVRSDGGDIRVVLPDLETQVPIEIESISTSNKTGSLFFKAPELSNVTDNVFYLFYGNSFALGYDPSDTYGAHNVWTNGYVGVWHMAEDPSGTAPQVKDSTVNNYSGTASEDMTSVNLVQGKLTNALSFNRTSNYVGFGTLNPLPNGVGAVNLWFKMTNMTNGVNNYLIAKGNDYTNTAWGIDILPMSATTAEAFLLYGNRRWS